MSFRFSKIFSLVFFLALIGLIAWAFPVINKRYLDDSSIENSEEKSSNKNNSETKKQEDFTNNSELLEENSNEDEEFSTEDESENEFLEITKDDCNNNCSEYTDQEDVQYCKQVCGLADSENPSTEKTECDGLSELKKDYCLKDLGIKNTDFSLCEKIVDKNIAKTCHNRILEEIMETGSPMQ
ncbi:MAG: hypothetical protein ACD_11C00018G0039 [uncultured bacterium]|nr:MAG: hypothetical protein ACD_11C00018G0039 [uncultured bacterium]HBR71564.1 hypothetical protein [Candidatus Moranbacteria bacterium]